MYFVVTAEGGDEAVSPLCHQINTFKILFITAQAGGKAHHPADPPAPSPPPQQY